jgi:hypothetical protein
MKRLDVTTLPTLSHMIRSDDSDRPKSSSWVQVYRELVEWGTLYSILATKDFGTDTLIVFDGLLRSKVFAKDDDERQAALIKTSISSYVGTATIALIAGGVVLFTYIQQNFRPSYWFYGLMLVATGALVMSFIFGGRGANATAIELASGEWTKDTKTKAFNLQALLTLVGLIVLIVAAAVGTLTSARPAAKDPCVMSLSRQLAKPHPDLKELRKELQACEIARS